MAGSLTVAILIVSTTAAKNPSTDASANVLRDILRIDGRGAWEVRDEKIVSDDVSDIQKQIIEWADGSDDINLIITTGGTGFAISDTTPEVGTLL